MPVATAKRAPRRDTLNLRIKPEERGLIERAADLLGKTRTDFVLDAARQAAIDAVKDRTLFMVDRETYAEFLAVLDAPPAVNDKLAQTLRTTVPWDRT